MVEQAAAGWYPDGHGNERYWDGSAWTEQLRHPQATGPTSPPISTQRRDSALTRIGAVVKKVGADKKEAKDEARRKQTKDAAAAGALVTSGVFGVSTVEVYEGGYVRVASALDNASQAGSITTTTPYEKLLSIKFTPPAQDGASGSSSGLVGTVNPVVAGLIKGGKGMLKGSVPGLAVAGIAHIAAAEGRRAFLTIATDKQIHTLTNQTSVGPISRSHKGHNEVGLALEGAGNSVLHALGGTSLASASDESPASEPEGVAVNQASAGPNLADRVRELAELHRDGMLSDEEFASAKAKLISNL